MKDPFEQLFGVDGQSSPDSHSRGSGSREPGLRGSGFSDGVSPDVAPRTQQFRTAPLPVQSVNRVKPWLVVGVVAILALVASSALIYVVRQAAGSSSQVADGARSESLATGSKSVSASGGSGAGGAGTAASGGSGVKPATDVAGAGVKPSTGRATVAPGSSGGSVPSVDVGDTFKMDVSQWGVSVLVSRKLSNIHYELRGENLYLTSDQSMSLPVSCQVMREGFGLVRGANGGYRALKPEKRCEDAPELYDELWGLMDAMAKTVKPL